MNDEGSIIGVNESGYNVLELINLAVALGILVAGALSIIYIFVGGISFITSGGDEGKIQQAVGTIRYAIIGLIITIFAVTIIAIIGSIFNFDLTSYIRWDRMTEIISGLIDRISGAETGIGNDDNNVL
jgi:hypothetical protein